MQSRKKQNFPLVEISWLDSSSFTGWQSKPESALLECWSAGYLVHKDKNSIVIALNCSSKASNNAFGDTMTIPRKVVTKIRRLK